MDPTLLNRLLRPSLCATPAHAASSAAYSSPPSSHRCCRTLFLVTAADVQQGHTPVCRPYVINATWRTSQGSMPAVRAAVVQAGGGPAGAEADAHVRDCWVHCGCAFPKTKLARGTFLSARSAAMQTITAFHERECAKLTACCCLLQMPNEHRDTASHPPCSCNTEEFHVLLCSNVDDDSLVCCHARCNHSSKCK